MAKISLSIAAFLFLSVISIQAYALDCGPLRPKGGEQGSTEFKGKVEGAVKGLFSKIVGAKADIEGAYRDVTQDVLKEYPNADRLYIWERLIFMQCELLDSSKLSDKEKLDQFNQLLLKMMAGPPQASRGPGLDEVDETEKYAELIRRMTENTFGDGRSDFTKSVTELTVRNVRVAAYLQRVARDGKVGATYRQTIGGSEYRAYVASETLDPSGETCRVLTIDRPGDPAPKEGPMTWCRDSSGHWLMRMPKIPGPLGVPQTTDRTELLKAIAEEAGSPSNAAKRYRRLAERGSAEAQNRLGRLYEWGRGVPKDEAEAARWYRKAAEQGVPEAQTNLATLYRDGRGVPQNYTEALRLYRKAAEQGFAPAQTLLGWMYDRGYGVDQDYAQAVFWYRKAAEQGDPNGQNNLGSCYHGGLGVPKNYTAAERWYRKAAEQGNANGQNNLGLLYRDGQGLPRDYAKAEFWFRKAAEQGSPNGQNNLGIVFQKGLGVPKNDTEAVRWFRKAAEGGFAIAQANLGQMYELGRGVERNPVLAMFWYSKAADQGDSFAASRLRALKKLVPKKPGN